MTRHTNIAVLEYTGADMFEYHWIVMDAFSRTGVEFDSNRLLKCSAVVDAVSSFLTRSY